MNGIFRNIFEKSFTGFMVVDPSTFDCLEINATAKETLGLLDYDGKQSLSLNAKSLFADIKRANVVNLNEKLIGQDGFYPEAAMKKLGGQFFYAELGIKHIKDDQNRDVLLLMFRDITYQLKLRREITNKQDEIEKAYAEMLRQNKELLALDKAKDRFIALTSHELRTPLSAMVATAEVLEFKLYDTEEQQKEFIHTIYDQGKYLLSIVNDILDFSKIQAGKLDVYISEQDPTILVKEVIELFENFAKEKSVEVVYNNQSQEPKCYFDKLRLRQVISNLMSNALKFTNPNTKVELRVESDAEYTTVSIIDNGPGIAKEAQDKIFNEFETLQNINTHHKGTGLGLPISRKLMQFQGGAIDIISDLGQGAAFLVRIPKNKILDEENYRERKDESGEDLAA